MDLFFSATVAHFVFLCTTFHAYQGRNAKSGLQRAVQELPWYVFISQSLHFLTVIESTSMPFAA
jgi:hypothetical protein